jgi:CHASE3 domain sensor protein
MPQTGPGSSKPLKPIQKLPDSQKRSLLFITVGLCMMAVIGLWYYQFQKTLRALPESEQNPILSQEFLEDFNQARQDFSEARGEINDATEEVKNQFDTTPQNELPARLPEAEDSLPASSTPTTTPTS